MAETRITDNMWDLKAHFETKEVSDTYRDFEGMLGGDDFEYIVTEVRRTVDVFNWSARQDDTRQMFGDILANLVAEQISEVGTAPTPDEVMNLGYSLHEVLSTRYWSKVTDQRW